MANDTEINQLSSQDPVLSDVVPYSKGDLQTFKTTWQKVKEMMGIPSPVTPSVAKAMLTDPNVIAPAQIMFDFEVIDSNNLFTIPGQFDIPSDGYYRIEAHAEFADMTAPMQMSFKKNGVAIEGYRSNLYGYIYVIAQLSQGDVITWFVNSAGGIGITPLSPSISIFKIN